MKRMMMVLVLVALGGCTRAPYYTDPRVGALNGYDYGSGGAAIVVAPLVIERAPVYVSPSYGYGRGHYEMNVFSRQGRFDYGMYGPRGPYPYHRGWR